MSGTSSLPRLRHLPTIFLSAGERTPVPLCSRLAQLGHLSAATRAVLCLLLTGSCLPCWFMPCVSCLPFPRYDAKPSLSPCLLCLSCPVPQAFLTSRSSVPFSPKWNSRLPLPQAKLVNSCAPPGPHSKPPLYKLLLDTPLGGGEAAACFQGPQSSWRTPVRFCLSPQTWAFKCPLRPSKPARGQEDLSQSTF